ncbi:hypothetical protein HY988_06340 [Candidatus Micrarchaeota archaeon]|nr:hypothetical protein [Candidatus Micrarchaeota archaeon]
MALKEEEKITKKPFEDASLAKPDVLTKPSAAAQAGKPYAEVRPKAARGESTTTLTLSGAASQKGNAYPEVTTMRGATSQAGTAVEAPAPKSATPGKAEPYSEVTTIGEKSKTREKKPPGE